MKLTVNPQNGNYVISDITPRLLNILHTQLSRNVIGLQHQVKLTDKEFIDAFIRDQKQVVETTGMPLDEAALMDCLNDVEWLRDLRNEIEKEFNTTARALEEMNKQMKKLEARPVLKLHR